MIPQPRSERHLSLFGVRCNNMATDDVFFPTMIAFALKATWMYVSLGVAIYLFLHPGCSTLFLPLLLSTSIIGFIAIHLVGIINDVIIMVISNLGSLSNFEPRKKVEIFFYIGCLIFLTQTGWNVFSTYAAFSPQVTDKELTNCTSYATAMKIYEGVILSHWGSIIFLIFLYVLWMDPLGCYNLQSNIQKYYDDITDLENSRNDTDSTVVPIGDKQGVHTNPASCVIWLRQCCKKRKVSTARKQALGDMVNTFKVLFEDWDYTFFDVRSGFKLMSLFHEKMREDNKDPARLIINKTIDALKTDENYEGPSETIQLENSSPELRKHVVDLKYYLDYAMASYGWPIYVYLNPFKGPISLCVSSKCNCLFASCQEQRFEGNICIPNEAAIKCMTGVEDEDIVTASFVNAVHIVPFYVVKVEREGKKQVIIAIRGTLSIRDALTDVSVSMCEVKDDLLGVHPSYVHRGFHQAALGIYEHLKEHETFQDLVTKQHYEIVLTGHSLGAAVSSVLAVLLKHNHPEWTENLKAFNFATPAVFNYPLAKKTDDFIISVVSGYDVVPRMTVRGLGHLILSVSDFIKNSKHSKQSIICCSGRCGCGPQIDTDAIEERHETILQELKRPNTESDNDDDDDYEIDGDKHTEHLSPGKHGGKRNAHKKPMIGTHLLKVLSRLFAKEESEMRVSSDHEEDREPLLFTPGRILHLEVEETDEMKSWCSCGLKHAGKVKASWKAREDLSGIQLHDSMLLDHGPTRTIDFITTLYDNLEEADK